MMGGFKRCFLDWIELNPLHLDLQDRWQLANGTKLLHEGIIHKDLLHIESAVNGRVDVSRARSNINFDVGPNLLFRTSPVFCRNVRLCLAIEQTTQKKKLLELSTSSNHISGLLLFDLV